MEGASRSDRSFLNFSRFSTMTNIENERTCHFPNIPASTLHHPLSVSCFQSRASIVIRARTHVGGYRFLRSAAHFPPEIPAAAAAAFTRTTTSLYTFVMVTHKKERDKIGRTWQGGWVYGFFGFSLFFFFSLRLGGRGKGAERICTAILYSFPSRGL